MTKSPVKFYAVSSLPESTANNNLYFVTGGELYKGATRFGAARVFVYSAATSGYVLSDGNNTTTYTDLAAIEASNAAARGDIAIDANSQTFVYDGSNWVEAGMTSQYVDSQIDSKIASLGNVMRFTGVVQAIPTTSVQRGDIVVVGSEPTGYINTTTGVPTTTPGEGIASLVQGQEYVCVDAENKKWELIGDQNTYATAAKVGAIDARVQTLESLFPSDGSSRILSVGTVSAGTVSAGTVSATDVSATTVSASDVVTSSITISGSTIEQIAQTAVGTFATGDADGQVKLGSTNATVSGWSTVKDDITFLRRVVTSTTVDETTTTKVTANAGEFTSLTVNGSTVEQIADSRISAITANAINSTGTSLPTESAVAAYVSEQIANKIDNITATAVSFSATSANSFLSDARTVDAALQSINDALTGIQGPSSSTSTGVEVSVSLTLGSRLEVAVSVSAATVIRPLNSQGTDGEPDVSAADHTILATEKAVRDAIEAARTELQLVWYDDEDANNEGSGTENP